VCRENISTRDRLCAETNADLLNHFRSHFRSPGNPDTSVPTHRTQERSLRLEARAAVCRGGFGATLVLVIVQ